MEALLLIIVVIVFGTLGLLLLTPLIIGALFLIDMLFGGLVETITNRKE